METMAAFAEAVHGIADSVVDLGIIVVEAGKATLDFSTALQTYADSVDRFREKSAVHEKFIASLPEHHQSIWRLGGELDEKYCRGVVMSRRGRRTFVVQKGEFGRPIADVSEEVRHDPRVAQTVASTLGWRYSRWKMHPPWRRRRKRR
jgi:hypothetical protein